MKTRTKSKRHSLLKNSLAILLMVAMLLQLGIFTMATGGYDWGFDFNGPVVYSRGVEIDGKIPLSADSYLSVRYDFDATLGEIKNKSGELEVFVSDDVVFEEGEYGITALDLDDHNLTVGDVTVGKDQVITVSFYDYDRIVKQLDSNNDYTTFDNPVDDGSTNTDGNNNNNDPVIADGENGTEGESDGNGEIGGESDGNGEIGGEPTEGGATPDDFTFDDGNDGNSEEVDYTDLELTVSFAILCTFDTDKEQVTVMSSGKEITVNLTRDDEDALTDEEDEQANDTEAILDDIIIAPMMTRDAVVSSGDFAELLADLTVTVMIDRETPEDIVDGSTVTISVNDSLTVTYSFTMSEEEAMAIKTSIGENIGALYLMSFPSWLDVISESIPLTTMDENNNEYQYAQIIVDGNGNVYILFTGDFWADTEGGTSDGPYIAGLEKTTIVITCSIDESQFLENTTHELAFDGGFKVNVVVEENEPKGDALAKTGAYDTTLNRFVWTVTYTPGNGRITLPLTLTDMYSNKTNNTYDEGSFVLTVTKPNGDSITVDESDGYFVITSGTFGTSSGVVICVLDESFFIDELDFSDAEISSGISLDGYTFVFSYYTELTAAGFQATSTISVKNEAVLTDAASLSLSADFTASVTATNKNLVTKYVKSPTPTGTYSTSRLDVNVYESVDWKVTFSTQNLNLSSLFLYELIPAGLTLSGDFTLTATNEQGEEVTCSIATPSKIDNYNSVTGDTLYTITIPKITSNEGDYYATNYTLTYSTTVNPRIFQGAEGETPFSTTDYYNKVWLAFTMDGYGTTQIELPVDQTGIRVNPNVIQKSPSYSSHYPYYNPSITTINNNTQYIRWSVMLNPHNVTVANEVMITDTIPTGLTYDETFNNNHNGTTSISSDRVWNGIYVSGIYDSNNNSLTFSRTINTNENSITYITYKITSTGDYNGKEIKFYDFSYDNSGNPSFKVDGLTPSGANLLPFRLQYYFYTTIDDAKIADNNTTGSLYTNQVTFNGKIGNTTITSSSDAKVTVYSKVLEKTGKSYDYNTNEITWEVKVNHNHIDMPDTVLYETIPEGLNYVTESVYIGNTMLNEFASKEAASGYSQYVIYNESTKKLEIYLGEISEVTTITFKTIVDVDTYVDAKNNSFTNSNSLIVDNTIYLDNKHTTTSVTASGSIEIKNDVLFKKGTPDDTGLVSYYVNINPNGLNLTNQVLEDTIPSGLELDFGSVKLYKVSVAAGEVFSTVANLTETNSELVSQWTWTYDETTRVFTITLPGSDSYILVYDCYVTDGSLKSADNTISFTGKLISSTINSVKTTTSNITGSSSFEALKNSLTVIKVDSEDESPIEGVTFQLCATVNGKEIVFRTGTTGADGKIIFKNLPLSWSYYLKETDCPTTHNIESLAYVEDSFNSDPPEGASYYDDTGVIKFTSKTANAEITFSNDPLTTSVTLDVTKELTGSEMKPDEFSFTLTETEFIPEGESEAAELIDPYSETVTNDKDGNVVFEDLKYTYKDIGIHKYDIVEDYAGKTRFGVAYDAGPYYVIVTVGRDDDTGELTTTTIYKKGEVEIKNIVFENKYDALTASVTLSASKTLTGRTLISGAFTFIVREGTEIVARGQNTSNGAITFSAITYGLEDVGTHTYTISEVNGGRRNYTYDSTEYTVVVTVSDNGDGTLSATYPSVDILFRNRYTSSGRTPTPDPDPSPEPSTEPSTTPSTEPSTPVTPPPSESSNPPTIDIPETPTPRYPGSNVVPDATREGVYIEIDEDGTPLGEWHQDDDGVWIFDEYPPLGDAPNTGDNAPIVILLLLVVISAVCIPVLLLKRRGYTLVSKKK